MVKDAETFAEEDHKKREAVETKNMAENVVYQTEKLLKEQGEKIAEDKKAKVEGAVEELKETIKSEDADAIKAKLEALNAEMQAVSADLYAQAKTESPEQEEAPPGDTEAAGAASDEEAAKKDDDEGEVIDADFEMVDDDKNKK